MTLKDMKREPVFVLDLVYLPAVVCKVDPFAEHSSSTARHSHTFTFLHITLSHFYVKLSQFSASTQEQRSCIYKIKVRLNKEG